MSLSKRDFDAALQKMPYVRYLGLEFDELRQRFHLPFREDLVGNANVPAVHGGAVGGFIEAAAMIWLLQTHQLSSLPKPVDFTVNFLHLARAQACKAECRLLRHGRRLVLVEVDCWQADKHVVTGRGHFLIDG